MLDWDNPLAPSGNKEKPTAEAKSVDATPNNTSSVSPRSDALSSEPSPVEPSASKSAPSTPTQPAAAQTEADKPVFADPADTKKVPPVLPLANAEPVNADDKRVINGHTDINQLAPFKYPWAWNYFLNANKNHWTPLDINMTQDVHDYQHKLTMEERHVYTNVLSYLTTSDILAMRNVGLAVMEKMAAPELQIYQARQVYEEALHTWTYQHCIETIGLDQGEIYNRYRVVPEIYQKIQLANTKLDSVLRSDIDLTDPDELENFIMAYAFFGGIFEGCWFYNGFSPIFALQRRGLMKGTAEQLQYIMRDEVMHASFGIRVVKQIIEEEQVTIDPRKIQAMFEEAEAAEDIYAGYILRDPILGYSREAHSGHFRFIANRRAKQLGFAEPFPGAESTLPWLDEQANMRKEKNFFETKVTEYQTGGGLQW